MPNAARLAAMIAGTGLALSTASVAQAIPAKQARCAFDLQAITVSPGAVPVPGLDLTVKIGSAGGAAIVQLSANMHVDPAAEVRVSYSVDGGNPVENGFGPANLDHQEFAEARTVIAVIPLPAGVHTVAPSWRVNGVTGAGASVNSRCATIEAATH